MAKKLKTSSEYAPVFNRIIVTCDAKNTTVSALLDSYATSRSAIGAWKKGNINTETIVAIADDLGVSLDYLIRGKENSVPSAELSDDEQELLTYYGRLHDIDKGRVLGTAKILADLQTPTIQEVEEKPETRYIEYSTLKVSAGTGQYLDTGLTEQLKIVKNDITTDASFAVKITGDSMEPLYEDGEIVLVKSQPTVELGEVGIFIVGGLGYIKKLGRDRLISVNPNYDDIIFHEWDEIYCKGLVVGVLEDDDIVD